MPKEVKAYQCKYCEAVVLDADQAQKAEASCPHNPALECCENCAFNETMLTPRYQNFSYPVKVCTRPPGEDAVFNAPHEFGWCPNWRRSQKFGGKE